MGSPQIAKGRVTGWLTRLVADSDDSDDAPDLLPVPDGSTVTLESAVAVERWVRATEPMMAFVEKLVCPVIGGRLYPPGTDAFALPDEHGVTVAATEQPHAEGGVIQWIATIKVKGATWNPPSFRFNVPTDGSVDIAVVVPETPVPGTVHVVTTEDRDAAIAAATEAKAIAIAVTEARDDARAQAVTATSAAETATAAGQTAVEQAATATSAAEVATAAREVAVEARDTARDLAARAAASESTATAAQAAAVVSASAADSSAARAAQAAQSATTPALATWMEYEMMLKRYRARETPDGVLTVTDMAVHRVVLTGPLEVRLPAYPDDAIVREVDLHLIQDPVGGHAVKIVGAATPYAVGVPAGPANTRTVVRAVSEGEGWDVYVAGVQLAVPAEWVGV